MKTQCTDVFDVWLVGNTGIEIARLQGAGNYTYQCVEALYYSSLLEWTLEAPT
jgi:hypothetical protein